MQDFAWTLRDVTTECDPMNAVRAKLRDCRQRRGLSYEEAGRRAGISGQWWRLLETGPQNITRTRLITMAKAVEWPPNEALKMAGMPTLLPVEAHQLAGDPRERLTEMMGRLSDARVRALLYVAKTMVDPDASDDEISIGGSGLATRLAERTVDTPQEPASPSIPARREDDDLIP